MLWTVSFLANSGDQLHPWGCHTAQHGPLQPAYQASAVWLLASGRRSCLGCLPSWNACWRTASQATFWTSAGPSAQGELDKRVVHGSGRYVVAHERCFLSFVFAQVLSAGVCPELVSPIFPVLLTLMAQLCQVFLSSRSLHATGSMAVDEILRNKSVDCVFFLSFRLASKAGTVLAWDRVPDRGLLWELDVRLWEFENDGSKGGIFWKSIRIWAQHSAGLRAGLSGVSMFTFVIVQNQNGLKDVEEWFTLYLMGLITLVLSAVNSDQLWNVYQNAAHLTTSSMLATEPPLPISLLSSSPGLSLLPLSSDMLFPESLRLFLSKTALWWASK